MSNICTNVSEIELLGDKNRLYMNRSIACRWYIQVRITMTEILMIF